MNQINPLYLLLSLIGFLFIGIFSLNGIKSEISEVKSEIIVTSNLADDIVALKRSWGDKKKSKQRVLKILTNRTIKNSGVTYQVTSSRVTIEAKSMRQKEFSYLMNKILNVALNITSIKARRLDKTHVSLRMEVSL